MFEQDFENMLRQYQDAVSDRKRFKGIVKDFFPQQIKNINLLLMAYDLGIADDIEKVSLIDNTFAFRYVKQLTDDYGLSRANADWVVSLWCDAFGRNVLRKPCDITFQENGKQAVKEDKPATKTYGDLFLYEASDDGTGLKITGFSGKRKDTVVFPNAKGNDKVTAIADEALCGEPVEAAILTDGILYIGKRAFEGCIRLHQSVLPFSVSEIDDRAFFGCISLRSISLTEQLKKIGAYAFSGTGLKKITIPDSVFYIGTGAFSDCVNLDNPVLPRGLREIPQGMFENCVILKKVSLPDSVELIGDRAFAGCSELELLTIPDSVKDIGDDAFTGTDRKFIIQCSFGSYAEEYARAHKIKYQLI